MGAFFTIFIDGTFSGKTCLDFGLCSFGTSDELERS